MVQVPGRVFASSFVFDSRTVAAKQVTFKIQRMAKLKEIFDIYGVQKSSAATFWLQTSWLNPEWTVEEAGLVDGDELFALREPLVLSSQSLE